MEENRMDLPEEETPETAPEDVKLKSPWQITKEGWYDKIPVTGKQMDLIVYVLWGLIGLTILCIALEAMGVIRLFG